MRDYSTDHCGFQSESPIEREERLASLAGAFDGRTAVAAYNATMITGELAAESISVEDFWQARRDVERGIY